MTGWQLLVRFLIGRNVKCVFGLPGTQNAELFSELSDAGIPIVTCAHETSAGFAAIGYAITSNCPGILLTIAGPGFCYALPSLVEASHDSVPVLHIVVRAKSQASGKFSLQDMDHAAVAGVLARGVVESKSPAALLSDLQAAWRLLTSGEPGPVVLLLDAESLNDGRSESTKQIRAPEQQTIPDRVPVDFEALAKELCAHNVGVIAGKGSTAAAAEVRKLVESMQWPVMTTVSGRGVVPESHPLNLCVDGKDVRAVNEAIEGFERVLVLGAKLSHNGAFGFRLSLPAERLVHVDRSLDVLLGRYDAARKIQMDVGEFVTGLVAALEALDAKTSNSAGSAAKRKPLPEDDEAIDIVFDAGETLDVPEYFTRLQRGFAEGAVWVTDSGLHQLVARRGLEIEFPNQLLAPIDFQSMGFGLPAAVGAAIAMPDREIVVIHGDGGLRMVGMDLLTAVQHECRVRVVVLDDGSFGLIRHQQLASGMTPASTTLPTIDYAALAVSTGAGFVDASEGLDRVFEFCKGYRGPVLIRQPVRCAPGQELLYEKMRFRGRLRRAIGPRLMTALRNLR